MAASFQAVRINDPLGQAQWQEMLDTLVSKNGGGDISLYLQVTRGVAPRDHALPTDITPTVFAMCSPLKPVPEDVRNKGVAAITLDDIRWQNCHIKSISLLANVLLRQEALDQGAAESILIRDGLATEGAASNLFAVIDGVLTTPPKGPKLLPGITRDLILELAQTHGIPHAEGDISREALRTAEEVWLSSSTKEILSVTRLDGQPMGDGKPGPLYRRMLGLFQDYKQQLRQG
jgi:D-alanine transaminase